MSIGSDPFGLSQRSGALPGPQANTALTQAAVSQHVRHLEQQLGALFLRRPRFIELTPAGMALLQYCQEMDSADRRLQAKLASADSDQGSLR
jgi:DNA-binding transcriptional LysR family regulator